MTEAANDPQTLVALFSGLADATAALEALQAAGVPYANITMGTHTADELQDTVGQHHTLPSQLWSLSVLIDEPLHSTSSDVMREHNPLVLGHQTAEHGGRNEVERGKTAWGHYVFEPVAATDRVMDAAGTSGTTGVISSGVFADGSVAEGKPSDAVRDQARG